MVGSLKTSPSLLPLRPRKKTRSESRLFLFTKMPIKPENKKRYPKNWNDIRMQILERAGTCCEFCGVPNHSYRYNPKTGRKAYIVLTIAHLNEVIEDVSPSNLRALCQRCHNKYDAKMRLQHRMETKAKKDKSLFIDFE